MAISGITNVTSKKILATGAVTGAVSFYEMTSVNILKQKQSKHFSGWMAHVENYRKETCYMIA